MRTPTQRCALNRVLCSEEGEAWELLSSVGLWVLTKGCSLDAHEVLGCDRACRGWQRGLGSGRHAGTSLVRDSRGGQAQGLGSHLESQFLLAESRLQSPDAGGAPGGPCGAEQQEWNLRAWAVVWRREGRAQVPPVPHASSDPCDGSRKRNLENPHDITGTRQACCSQEGWSCPLVPWGGPGPLGPQR